MPEISKFLGIIIMIFYKDHSPPHFHAKYSDKSGISSIPDLKMLEGNLPPKVISLKNELLIDWELAQKGSPLKKIELLV